MSCREKNILRQEHAFRMSRRLTDFNCETEVGKLATIYEPVLVSLGNGVLEFRGLESIIDARGQAGYAQGWRCEPVGERGQIEPGATPPTKTKGLAEAKPLKLWLRGWDLNLWPSGY